MYGTFPLASGIPLYGRRIIHPSILYSSSSLFRYRRPLSVISFSLSRTNNIGYGSSVLLKYFSTNPSSSSDKSSTVSSTLSPSSSSLTGVVSSSIIGTNPAASFSDSDSTKNNQHQYRNRQRRQRWWYYGIPFFSFGTSMFILVPFGYWLYVTAIKLSIDETYLFRSLPTSCLDEYDTFLADINAKQEKRIIIPTTIQDILHRLRTLTVVVIRNTYNYGIIDTLIRWTIGLSCSSDGKTVLRSVIVFDSINAVQTIMNTEDTSAFYLLYSMILEAWLEDSRNDSDSQHRNLFAPIVSFWPSNLHQLLSFFTLPRNDHPVTINRWQRQLYDTLSRLIEAEINYQSDKNTIVSSSVSFPSESTVLLHVPSHYPSNTQNTKDASLLYRAYTTLRTYLYAYAFRDQIFSTVHTFVRFVSNDSLSSSSSDAYASSLVRNIGWLILTSSLSSASFPLTTQQHQQLEYNLSSTVAYFTLQHLRYLDTRAVPSSAMYGTSFTDFLLLMNTLFTLQQHAQHTTSSQIPLPYWYNQAFHLWNSVYLILRDPSPDNASLLRLSQRSRVLSYYVRSVDTLPVSSSTPSSLNVAPQSLYAYFLRIHGLLLHLTCKQPQYLNSLIFGHSSSSLASSESSLPLTADQISSYSSHILDLLYDVQRILDYLAQNDPLAYEQIIRTFLHRPALEPLVHVSIHDILHSFGYAIYQEYTIKNKVNDEESLVNKEWLNIVEDLERGQDMIDGVFRGQIYKFRQRMIIPFRESSVQTFPEKITSSTSKLVGSIYGKTRNSLAYLQGKLGLPTMQKDTEIGKDWNINLPFTSNSMVYADGNRTSKAYETKENTEEGAPTITNDTHTIPSSSELSSEDEHPLSQSLFIMDDDLGIGLGTGIKISMVPRETETLDSVVSSTVTNDNDDNSASSVPSYNSSLTIEIEPSAVSSSQTRGALQRHLATLYRQVLLSEDSLLLRNNVDNVYIPVYSSTAGSSEIIHNYYEPYKLYETGTNDRNTRSTVTTTASSGTGTTRKSWSPILLSGPSVLDLLLCYIRSAPNTDKEEDNALLKVSSHILKTCILPLPMVMKNSDSLATVPPKGNDNTTLASYRTTIARAWLQSIFYSLIYATHPSDTTRSLLSNDTKISAVREYGRWISREIARIPLNLPSASFPSPAEKNKTDGNVPYTYSPRYIYQLANYHAQGLSIKGTLPPLISDIYNPLPTNFILEAKPPSTTTASSSPLDSVPEDSIDTTRNYLAIPSFGSTLPSIDIHMVKAFAYLLSGNTPDDLSFSSLSSRTNNNSMNSLQRSLTHYLCKHQAHVPMYILLTHSIDQMNDRYNDILRYRKSRSISSSLPLSSLLQDRIYRDYCTTVRQYVRLWSNFGYTITPEECQTVRTILPSSFSSLSFFPSLLYHHDSKLRGHVWRCIHNWTILKDSKANVRYGDLIYPLYDNAKTNDEGIDIVFVHGLQGLSLKTWRTNTYVPSIDTYSTNVNHDSSSSVFSLSNHPTLQYAQASVYRDKKVLPIWPVLWLANDLEKYGTRSNLSSSVSSSSESSSSSPSPNIRILALAYDADVWGGPNSTIRPHIRIEDTAAEAARELVQAGIGQSSSRRTIFIGHSMGGLFIKWLLLHAATATKDSSNAALSSLSPELALLVKNTSSVVFLGVPHHGAPLAAFAVQNLGHIQQYLPKKIFTPSGHVETLGETAILENLNTSFKELIQHYPSMQIVSCAEGLPTLIPGLPSSFVDTLLQSSQKISSLLYTKKTVENKGTEKEHNSEGNDENVSTRNSSMVSSYTHIQVVPIVSADPGYGKFMILNSEDHLTISKPSSSTNNTVYQLILQQCQQGLDEVRSKGS